jgi:hypothetical protein
MRKLTFIIIGLVLAGVVVLPWLAAYRSDQAVRYSYGRIDGHQLECVAVDGTHFDRYFCLVFDDSASQRVNCSQGQIFLDGRRVQFPAGQNVGLLRPDGQIQFVAVTERDIPPDSSGSSEIYYIFGKVPKLKRFTFGVPRAEFIEQRFHSLK